MPLQTYTEARASAEGIRDSVTHRRMPPWLADPKYGGFANTPHLNDDELRILETWVISGAAAGRLPKPRATAAIVDSDEISANLVVTAPKPITIPANKTREGIYLVFALPFMHDRWIRAAEIRPGNPNVVQYAVLYAREQRSPWLQNATPGVPYVPSNSAELRDARKTTAEILAIYTPAGSAMICPDGMAKKLPAGAGLILEVHYANKDLPIEDEPQIGLSVLNEAPKKRIFTLQMNPSNLSISPVETNFTVSVSGRLSADALLTSIFPYTPLRGVAFDFDIVESTAPAETLLKVAPYGFDWHPSYLLKTPRPLQKGTLLKWTFIHSVDNQPGWNGIITGFFDVAVDPSMDTTKVKVLDSATESKVVTVGR